ncbi:MULTISPECIES: helix-turn-helix domain-containing protein [unclassified Streptomyces]|uniref:Helix-turn-helix domain-containing protein n=1 Tax=Streptomyces sp. NBC_00060 TaxID=2975636 RepID=A0AAU2H403_9ACTN
MPRSAWVLTRRRAVGDRIREARLHAKLSQKTAAIRCDMDRATYNRIKQGQSSPSLDSLILIAEAIRIPPAHLVAA